MQSSAEETGITPLEVEERQPKIVSELRNNLVDLHIQEQSASFLGTSERLSPEAMVIPQVEERQDAVEEPESKIYWEVVIQTCGLSVIKLSGTNIPLQFSKKFEYLLILPKKFPEAEVEVIKNMFSTEQYSSINLHCGFCNNSFCNANDVFLNLTENVTTTNQNEYRCKICNRMKYPLEKLKSHIFQHILSKDVFCDKCKKTQHSLSIIEEEQLCSDRTPETRNLNEMWKSCLYYQTAELCCQCCRTIITNGRGLKTRLLKYAFESDTISYRCNICKEIKREGRATAELHVLNHFTSEKVFCSECLLKGSIRMPAVLVDETSTSNKQEMMILNKSLDMYIRMDGASSKNDISWIDYGEYCYTYHSGRRVGSNFICNICKVVCHNQLKALKQHFSMKHTN